MWLFGGSGYPYPSPFGKQLPGLLNDLWVFNGSWVPANLNSTFVDKAGDWQVDISPLEEVDASGFYSALHASSGGFPGARWGSTTWTDSSGNLWMFGGQGVVNGGSALLNDLWEWIPAPRSTASFALTTRVPSRASGSGKGAQTRGPRQPGGAYGTKGRLRCQPSRGSLGCGKQDGLAGNVWLFGGQGLDSAGTPDYSAICGDTTLPAVSGPGSPGRTSPT